MPCSKGAGPTPHPRVVVLTVFFRGPVRSIYYETTRPAAALRLKWARHLDGFRGYVVTEVVA